MTEEELNQYRDIKDEIKLLSLKIDKCEAVTDKVKGSIKDFPYTEVNFNVAGVDSKAQLLKQKRITKRAELINKEEGLHDFIYSMPDSQIRQIFIYRFLDGLTQKQIAKKMHIDRSVVSRKIANYLNKQN